MSNSIQYPKGSSTRQHIYRQNFRAGYPWKHTKSPGLLVNTHYWIFNLKANWNQGEVGREAARYSFFCKSRANRTLARKRDSANDAGSGKGCTVGGPFPGIRKSTVALIIKAETPKETNVYWFTAHKNTYCHSEKHLNNLAPKT